jgi:thiol-disulfide isomerase/thioredoxin
MIGLILAGRAGEARAVARPASAAEPAVLPAFTLTDLEGRPLTRDSLAGRAVLVEFWATWCPPCRSTLRWLGELQRRFGGRVAVVALALESDAAQVRKLAAELGLPFQVAMADSAVVGAFGGIGAVPTLFLFGPDGRGEAVFYGAPPTLHADAEARLAKVAGGK